MKNQVKSVAQDRLVNYVNSPTSIANTQYYTPTSVETSLASIMRNNVIHKYHYLVGIKAGLEYGK